MDHPDPGVPRHIAVAYRVVTPSALAVVGAFALRSITGFPGVGGLAAVYSVCAVVVATCFVGNLDLRIARKLAREPGVLLLSASLVGLVIASIAFPRSDASAINAVGYCGFGMTAALSDALVYRRRVLVATLMCLFALVSLLNVTQYLLVPPADESAREVTLLWLRTTVASLKRRMYTTVCLSIMSAVVTIATDRSGALLLFITRALPRRGAAHGARMSLRDAGTRADAAMERHALGRERAAHRRQLAWGNWIGCVCGFGFIAVYLAGVGGFGSRTRARLAVLWAMFGGMCASAALVGWRNVDGARLRRLLRVPAVAVFLLANAANLVVDMRWPAYGAESRVGTCAVLLANVGFVVLADASHTRLLGLLCGGALGVLMGVGVNVWQYYFGDPGEMGRHVLWSVAGQDMTRADAKRALYHTILVLISRAMALLCVDLLFGRAHDRYLFFRAHPRRAAATRSQAFEGGLPQASQSALPGGTLVFAQTEGAPGLASCDSQGRISVINPAAVDGIELSAVRPESSS